MNADSTPPPGPSGTSGRRVAAIVAVVMVVAAAAVVIIWRTSARSERSGTQTTTDRVVAPLTGLVDPSGVAGHRCAVSVKIGNTPEARPQYGLELADVVYEEVVEGGITRLVAVFHSQAPDRVGPVRSVRSTDQSILWPLRGIFAYSGGNPTEVASLAGTPVLALDEVAAGPMMFRDPTRPMPHNLYAHVDQMFGRCDSPPPPALFTYRSAQLPPAGDPVASVRIGFVAGYAVTWTWDAGSSTWQRSIFGAPDLDAAGRPLSVENVVVMRVHYASDPDGATAEGILTGQGPLSVFTGGRVIQGTWVRPDRAKPAELLDSQQQPIPLAPGQTWVELPDLSHAITTTR